jgi:hypothetical protein
MRILTPDVKSLAKNKESGIHERLVKQGRTWARHVQEPWEILVLVGAYLIVSVGLGLPIFGVIATILQQIIISASGGEYGNYGTLSFSPCHVHMIQSQPAVYTVIGLFIQFVDAGVLCVPGEDVHVGTALVRRASDVGSARASHAGNSGLTHGAPTHGELCVEAGRASL